MGFVFSNLETISVEPHIAPADLNVKPPRNKMPNVHSYCPRLLRSSESLHDLAPLVYLINSPMFLLWIVIFISYLLAVSLECIYRVRITQECLF